MQPGSTPVRFGRSANRRQSESPSSQRRSERTAHDGRWSRLTWPLSMALFAVPLALLVMTAVMPRFAAPPQLALVVTDRYSGQPIPGAEITLNGVRAHAGDDGMVRLTLAGTKDALRVEADGYEGVEATLQRDMPPEWSIALRPNVLTGRVTDAQSAAGIADVTVALKAPDGSEQSTVTDGDGRYAFANVPDGATVQFSSADYGVSEEQVQQQTTIDLSMKSSFITGTVTDGDGAPVAGARVAAVNAPAETLTDASGAYRLSRGQGVQEVDVSAPGFASQRIQIDDNRQANAQLDTETIKAVYANLGVLGDEQRWNELLRIADTTEINAIVIDVKQDTIYYDTQVPFFREIDGMVTPVLDMPGILAQLKERGIYAIARMVVFKDPVVAQGRPDLAVKDEITGEPWLDMNGTPWVNAFNQELWVANADLAAELVQMGFDEVQYDYIRFPSDGDLRTADFGNSYSEEERRAAITGAVKLGAEKVHAAGGQFAIDLFPIIALMGDDQGIGQTLQDLAPLADYVCLMIYPSHYTEGNIPVDGHPNDFPSETVLYTLERSQEWAPGTMKKMRPWLQDFTYPLEGYSEYGPEQVREQIDAAEASGVTGWMLWNAAGQFQVSALDPG